MEELRCVEPYEVCLPPFSSLMFSPSITVPIATVLRTDDYTVPKEVFPQTKTLQLYH